MHDQIRLNYDVFSLLSSSHNYCLDYVSFTLFSCYVLFVCHTNVSVLFFVIVHVIILNIYVLIYSFLLCKYLYYGVAIILIVIY